MNTIVNTAESNTATLQLPAETQGTLAGLRDAAMIRLMSDCLLRISEVVAVNLGDLNERTLTVHAFNKFLLHSSNI